MDFIEVRPSKVGSNSCMNQASSDRLGILNLR